MNLAVIGAAAIGGEDVIVVDEKSMAGGRLDTDGGSDSCKDHGLYAFAAQHEVEVGIDKRAKAMLGDGRVFRAQLQSGS